MWNTPIPANAALQPNSGAIIAKLASGVGKLAANARNWTVPVHVVNSAKVSGSTAVATSGAYHESVDADQNGRSDALVPFVKEMWPDPKSDSHMAIVDPLAGVSWEFSRVSEGGGRWTSSTHAIWDLNGSGMGVPFSGKSWWRQGSRGSGVPLIAGLVRPEEIEAGEIRHALVFATSLNGKNISGTGTTQLVPPAARSDARYTGADYLLEGARIQLDPTLDVSTLGLSPAGEVVARAMQTYGAINGDNSSGMPFYFQPLGPTASGSEQAWENRFPGLLKEISKIPLDRFRVLEYQNIAEK